ncbi:MAG: 50S ribosomal protein L13 [Patescibacteria group bacterium]
MNKETKIIDADGKTLGRVASEAATFLMGKTKATYERHIYSGLPVKIINAAKLRITTKKLAEIYHTRYSGSRGGLKTMTGTYTAKTKGLKELIRLAIHRMLPRNKLRREMEKNLKIED